MKDTKWFIFTFLSTILIFSAIPLSLYLTSSDITPYDNLEMALNKFSSYEELTTFLDTIPEGNYYNVRTSTLDTTGGMTAPQEPAPIPSPTFSGEESQTVDSDGFSKTNVQVEGVDEADIVKLRRKLGLYVEEIQDGSNNHNLNMIIVNQATGRWMKRSPTENPYVLADQLGNWLDGWKRPPEGDDYANAPKLRSIPSGEQLFRTRCQSCHTVSGSELPGALGPDLLGVTWRRDETWLLNWLRALRSDPDFKPKHLKNDEVPYLGVLFKKSGDYRRAAGGYRV